MRYMLDTNICIYAIKNKPESVLKKLLSLDPSSVCISSITYAELCHGVYKSAAVNRNKIALSLLLANIEVIKFDTCAAECYGKIRAELEQKGTPIGPLDTMIAGHAKSLNCIVVTNNIREFMRVDSLQVENWVEEQ